MVSLFRSLSKIFFGLEIFTDKQTDRQIQQTNADDAPTRHDSQPKHVARRVHYYIRIPA